MRKSEAAARRKTVEILIQERQSGYYRSVDDWYVIVADAWPSGLGYAPCKSTVKKVLFNLSIVGRMKHKTFSRGWFTQERFS